MLISNPDLLAPCIHVCGWIGLSSSPSFQGKMYVVKRDGRRETVQFDKITARIKKLVSPLEQNLKRKG